jgi:methyl-accepting chemotaxis protein
MATDAKPMPQGAARRKWRNYLLDRGFQLKYTGYVVLITVVVTSVVGGILGYTAYEKSRGMSQMLTMQRGDTAGSVTPEMQALFEQESAEEDAQLAREILSGLGLLILVMSVALGLMGILITHRVVGPAYKLKLLFAQVERGSLLVRGGFRKRDELQDLGVAFKRMIASLHERREEELQSLEAALERARSTGADARVVTHLEDLRRSYLTLLGREDELAS